MGTNIPDNSIVSVISLYPGSRGVLQGSVLYPFIFKDRIEVLRELNLDPRYCRRVLQGSVLDPSIFKDRIEVFRELNQDPRYQNSRF